MDTVLADWLKKKSPPRDAALLLDALNGRIEQAEPEDRDFRIGPSYLMRPAGRPHRTQGTGPGLEAPDPPAAEGAPLG
ncbi:hypothetical protein ACGRHY_18075 [Streptomyces sp. HK10]|uniref:hypothetical protein n=1 Tax=Streptomyces sp. HK10 TaxID=3373255 RepID=UPI003748B01D